MRYWILAVLLSGLFTLVIHFAAPEMFGSTGHYAGMTICALISTVITWRDPPDLAVLSGVPILVSGWVFWRQR